MACTFFISNHLPCTRPRGLCNKPKNSLFPRQPSHSPGCCRNSAKLRRRASVCTSDRRGSRLYKTITVSLCPDTPPLLPPVPLPAIASFHLLPHLLSSLRLPKCLPTTNTPKTRVITTMRTS